MKHKLANATLKELLSRRTIHYATSLGHYYVMLDYSALQCDVRLLCSLGRLVYLAVPDMLEQLTNGSYTIFQNRIMLYGCFFTKVFTTLINVYSYK